MGISAIVGGALAEGAADVGIAAGIGEGLAAGGAFGAEAGAGALGVEAGVGGALGEAAGAGAFGAEAGAGALGVEAGVGGALGEAGIFGSGDAAGALSGVNSDFPGADAFGVGSPEANLGQFSDLGGADAFHDSFAGDFGASAGDLSVTNASDVLGASSDFSGAPEADAGQSGAAGDPAATEVQAPTYQGGGSQEFGQAQQPGGGQQVTSADDPKIRDQPYTGEGTGGRAAKAAAGGKGAFGQFNPGSLISSLLQGAMGPSRPSALGQQSAVGQQLQDQATQLLNAYNQGQLPAAMMAQVQTQLQANLNRIRQFYRSSGNYNSTGRIAAENQAYLQATASMAQALQQELTTGLQALGQAGAVFGQVANATIASDNAFRSSLNSALGSILRLPVSGGAQTSNPASLSMSNQFTSPPPVESQSEVIDSTGFGE